MLARSPATVAAALVGLLAASLWVPSGLAVTSRKGRKTSLKRMMKLGSQYFKKKNYGSAYKVWRKVGDKLVEKKLYENPRKVAIVAKLRYLIGFSLFKAKKYQGAMKYWRQCLSLVPNHPKALKGLKLLYKAQKIDREEVSPDPDFPEPRQVAAAPVIDPEPPPVPTAPDPSPGADPAEPAKPDEPVDVLEEVQVKEDKQKAQEAWSRFKMARTGGKTKKSIEALVEAYKYGKDKPTVDYNLGHAFLRDEQPERAVIHFTRALENEEEDHMAVHLAMGKAHGLMEDIQKEIASYKRVLQLDPDYGEAHFMLALAYDKVSNSPKVLEHAQRAIRIDPEYKEKLKPRIKDSNVSKQIGKIVTNVLRDSKYERLTDAKIEEYAEEIGRILGEENLNTNDFMSNSKGKIKNVISDIRDGKKPQDAVAEHIPTKERTQFLRAYRKSSKMKNMFKEIKNKYKK